MGWGEYTRPTPSTVPPAPMTRHQLRRRLEQLHKGLVTKGPAECRAEGDLWLEAGEPVLAGRFYAEALMLDMGYLW
jgi:hypothetical protein